ncbi:uncharacterized protein LOC111643415 [Copidosoma floridanum]|uniref:uncharacterized protein LOC111643415 n=1 Tax=Copidosoma floridanum TaxID=29053 RepID=UPI000C6F5D51|nr:uncharacterized protein LOC111643415 [Copidosoma floridanum]
MDETGPNNVRPIANLGHFAKVFDVIVAQQVSSFLENQNLLSPMQSGFRRHHSTQSALLKITEDICLGMERDMITILVLFDFRRVFDLIGHAVLLRIMADMGFSADAVAWFHSYLSGQSQAVLDLSGDCTAFLPSTSGIPQGSSTRPIIFLIFINSVLSVLRHSVGVLFADDLQCYIQCAPSDARRTIHLLNQDISGVVAWSDEHGLDFSWNKLQAIIMGTRQQLLRVDKAALPPILAGTHVIPLSDCVKDLGVYLTDDLTWNRHVAAICSRVHGILYRLRYKGGSLSSKFKEKLATTLIWPHFDYACLVFADVTPPWGRSMPDLSGCALALDEITFLVLALMGSLPPRSRVTCLTFSLRHVRG